MDAKNKKNPTFVFHHIMKTGGTSFSNWMTSVLGKDSTLHVRLDDKNKIDNISISELKRFKGFHGHGAFHVLKHINNFLNITLVRDPISFALSRYVFDREHKIKHKKSLKNLQPLLGEVNMTNFHENLIKFCFGPVFNAYPYMYSKAAFHLNPKLLTKYFDPEFTIMENLNKLKNFEKKKVLEKMMNCFEVVWTTDNLIMLCFILMKKYNLKSQPIYFANATQSNEFYLTDNIKQSINKHSIFNQWIYEIAVKKMDLYVKNFFNENPQYYIEFLTYKKSCINVNPNFTIIEDVSFSTLSKRAIKKVKNVFLKS